MLARVSLKKIVAPQEYDIRVDKALRRLDLLLCDIVRLLFGGLHVKRSVGNVFRLDEKLRDDARGKSGDQRDNDYPDYSSFDDEQKLFKIDLILIFHIIPP